MRIGIVRRAAVVSGCNGNRVENDTDVLDTIVHTRTSHVRPRIAQSVKTLTRKTSTVLRL